MLRNALRFLSGNRSAKPQRLNVAVFNDTRPTRHVGCQIVMRELINNLQRQDMEPVWFHPVGVDWRDNLEALPRRGDVDAVIVNGEGSIHHSQTRPRARFLPEIARFARDRLSVPAFLVNSTLYAIDDQVGDDLRVFESIFVRESQSQDVLTGFGIASSIVPDLTIQAPIASAGVRQGVCGTDSVIVSSAQLIRDLCKANGYPYRGMIRIPKSEETSNDVVTAHVQEYCRWLSSHELVLTGRFHTVTLCIATRTPFIAVESNTPKISAFVRDILGSTNRIVEASALAGMDLTQMAGWTQTEQQTLNDVLPRVRSATNDMFSAIRLSTIAARRRGA